MSGVIFGKKRKKGMRRQDSKARVRTWRNMLVTANILILLAAVAYVPLKHTGLIDRWLTPSSGQLRQSQAALALPNAPANAPQTASAGADLARQTPPKTRISEKSSPSPTELIAEAEMAIANGSLDSAERLINKALDVATLDSDRANALNLRGQILRGRESYEEAAAQHLAAIRAWPALDSSYMLLADNLRILGHATAAMAILQEGSARFGEHPFFELKLMLARVEAGQEGAVSQDIRSRIMGKELPAHLAYVQAVIMHRLGNRSEARKLAESIHRQASENVWKVLSSDPATPSSWSTIDGITRVGGRQ